jgi:peptide deformylase
MDVLIYPDPILRHGGKPITEFGEELQGLADRMIEAMYVEGGVGLAAPQVGIEQKLLVLNPSGSKDDRSGELVICNPKIVRKKKKEFGEEGCLSFPGIQADVERAVEITVVYQDINGEEQSLKCDGWLARIVQHEIDHLEGVFFVDRLTSGEKLRVKSQLLELESQYKPRA